MEQKQLDEVEQPFLGEEFMDEEVIIEQARPKAKAAVARPKKEGKEIKKMERKTEEKKVVEARVPKAEKSRNPEPSPESSSLPGKETAAREEPKAEPRIEVWSAEPKTGRGLLAEVSTWKALTGIVLIVLLLSVFTQGFSFAKGNGLTAAAISQNDAEAQALAFVNDNLLQPPFAAKINSSEDLGALYKITFSIAGEEVNSYITRDGALFFPQGFDPKRSLVEQLTAAGTSGTAVEATTEARNPNTNTISPGAIEEVIINGTTGEVTVREVPPEEIAAEAAPGVAQTDYTITAKKWLFSPNRITVPMGSAVTLQIVPENIPAFTFLLPAFNVRREVSGPATIQFTADKKGSFPFLCGSCEDFRGMTGTLVVE